LGVGDWRWRVGVRGSGGRLGLGVELEDEKGGRLGVWGGGGDWGLGVEAL
jgi:hypothetical protein